jgi:hypothetical protein
MLTTVVFSGGGSHWQASLVLFSRLNYCQVAMYQVTFNSKFKINPGNDD